MKNQTDDNFFLKIDEIVHRAIEKSQISPERTSEFIEDKMVEILSSLAPIVLKGIKAQVPSIVKHNRLLNSSSKKLINHGWKKPLDQIKAFVEISSQISESVNENVRLSIKEESRYYVEVLTRLHGQACLIAKEILLLICHGYADGANARWRSLHEIVVTAFFIEKYGNSIAKMYLEHSNIESYKALSEYQKWNTKLDLLSISEGESKNIADKRNQLFAIYGKSFGNNYGWAASALHKEKPNFVDIETDVGLDHLRPYYRFASHHIHSNPKCIQNKLGLPDVYGDILAGPSNLGLADPGQVLIISLNQINTIILSLQKSMTICVIQLAMNQWVNEICEQLIKANNQVKDKIKC
jgi:hypothetical protein